MAIERQPRHDDPRTRSENTPCHPEPLPARALEPLDAFPLDRKRCPETTGYLSIRRGGDSDKFRKLIEEYHPEMDHEKIDHLVQHREMLFAYDQLDRAFVRTIQTIAKTIQVIQKDRSICTLEDVMRKYSGMSERQIRAFKGTHPGLFNSTAIGNKGR